jgi:Major Facilitator Superfamily
LSIYNAAAAIGASLGFVIGGLLTELGWRWVFFLPVPIALVTLLAALRFVPVDSRPARSARAFDLAGAVSLTAAMLLLVFTLVEAAATGWGSARTLGSFAGVAALLIAFVARERRTSAPLVRLGILRSGPLVRANLGAMSLFGGWVGFQFIATLYLQRLRGWSPLETGLAIFPAAIVVALFAPRLAPLIARVGVTRLILLGLLSTIGAYALFLPVGLDSGYAADMLPTFLLVGLGFALAYGPLNIAATNGIAPAEQGLAAGLLNTSFQFGGALVLAVVTAVDNAYTSADGSAQALLNGYHAAIVVPLIAGALGVVAMSLRRRRNAVPPAQIEPATELATEAEAA